MLFSPTIMADKPQNTKWCRACDTMKALVIGEKIVKMMQSLWETFWHFLIQSNKIPILLTQKFHLWVN